MALARGAILQVSSLRSAFPHEERLWAMAFGKDKTSVLLSVCAPLLCVLATAMAKTWF